jgi:hypothetical protein
MVHARLRLQLQYASRGKGYWKRASRGTTAPPPMRAEKRLAGYARQNGATPTSVTQIGVGLTGRQLRRYWKKRRTNVNP